MCKRRCVGIDLCSIDMARASALVGIATCLYISFMSTSNGIWLAHDLRLISSRVMYILYLSVSTYLQQYAYSAILSIMWPFSVCVCALCMVSVKDYSHACAWWWVSFRHFIHVIYCIHRVSHHSASHHIQIHISTAASTTTTTSTSCMQNIFYIIHEFMMHEHDPHIHNW